MKYPLALCAAFVLAALPVRLAAQNYSNLVVSGVVLYQMTAHGKAAPPSLHYFDTTTLLNQLAADETAAHVWSSRPPAGSTLTYGSNGIWVSGPHDQVWMATNILSFTPPTAVTAPNSVTYGAATLAYDSTALGGTNKYFITGYGTTRARGHNVRINATTYYSILVDTMTVHGAAGQGVSPEGAPMVFRNMSLTARATTKTLATYGSTTSAEAPPPASSQD